uniref:Uncharacterized protein n=1 Tax=Rhizophora mucronata TaxID=61149 RepID=A0A2P2N3J5_RHIMU
MLYSHLMVGDALTWIRMLLALCTLSMNIIQ